MRRGIFFKAFLTVDIWLALCIITTIILKIGLGDVFAMFKSLIFSMFIAIGVINIVGIVFHVVLRFSKKRPQIRNDYNAF